MNVAIYIRVSTLDQAREGYSLEAQEKSLRKWCEDKKYTIYNVYADRGISGKDIKHRPDMNRLLNDAKENKFDMVLFWALSRLTRSVSDLYDTLEKFQKWNISMVSYTEAFDTSSPMGRAMIGIVGIFAQLERELTGERVYAAMEAEQKAEDERQRKNEADAMYFENNIEAFNTLVLVGKFEVKRWAYTALVMDFSTLNNRDYDYSLSTSYKVEVARITDSTFKATMQYSEYGSYKPYEISFVTFEQLLAEIKAFNDKFMILYDSICTKRAEIDLKRQADTKLKNLCYSIVGDKDKTYIFKTKSGFFAVNGICKWSMKGEGKYMRCFPDKLFEMIQDGKIKGYTLSSEEEATALHGKTEQLKALNYISIA